MQLKILVPSGIFLPSTEVIQVMVDTTAGSVGILAHRRDCMAALVPGLLGYQLPGRAMVYVAADEGILVKVGPDVLVSVRQAVGGTDLIQLHALVRQKFLHLDNDERQVRTALAKIESRFLNQLAQLHHER
jgi:F-type H+-transporting ATPase subunit epsilon